MTAANEHVGLFTPMEGTFNARVSFFMGGPEPMVSTGTMVNSWDLGGTFLKQVYVGDSAEGPFPNFQGRGYFGFNPTTGQYEGFWIDIASTMMQLEYGAVDSTGKKWEMHSEFIHPQTRQNCKKRSVIEIADPNQHTMTTMMQFGDAPEQKVMEIQFTRRG